VRLQRKYLSIIIGSLLCLVATGCGEVHADSSGAAVTASPASPVASVSQSLLQLPQSDISVLAQTLVTDPGLGGKFSPPPAGAVPSVSAAAAWVTFQGLSMRPELLGQPFTIALADYSNNVQGPVPSPGAPINYTYSAARLSWVVFYRNVAPPARQNGPAGDSYPSPDPNAPHNCDFDFVVDATTGQYVTAFSECNDALVVVPSASASTAKTG
jgi:hypothetical protein